MTVTGQNFPELFWWPNPSAFDDLSVIDAEGGFTLEAPDDSECGEWLAYWNQSPEHIELFTQEFTEALKNNIDTILEQNGQTEEFSDGQQCDSE